MKLKMKVTAVVYYEADSKHYGTKDPEKMVKIDQENFEGDHASMFGMDSYPEILVEVDEAS